MELNDDNIAETQEKQKNNKKQQQISQTTEIVIYFLTSRITSYSHEFRMRSGGLAFSLERLR